MGKCLRKISRMLKKVILLLLRWPVKKNLSPGRAGKNRFGLSMRIHKVLIMRPYFIRALMRPFNFGSFVVRPKRPRRLNTHSHKKRKESLETRVVLFIFSLELEISGVIVQIIH